MPTEPLRRLGVLATTLWALAFGVTVPAAHAQGFAAYITPPRFELRVQPGKTLRQVFELQQTGNARGQYRVYTNDWVFQPDQTVEFADALAPDSCRPWVAIERREFTVEPGARYRYRFEITTPADTPPRECRFAIMVEGRDATVGGNVQAAGRIGVIVYAAVGDAAPRLELADTRVETLNGQATPVLLVRNTGNAHGRLEGFVSGTDDAGQRIEFGPADLPILPGETRRVPLVALGEGKQAAPTVRFPVRIQGKLEWGRTTLALDARFAP
ncbi:MAG: hypothetical protein GTN84_01100 [Hydrogenophaga sp.]|uniref:COG1470 family protein n=1 Tax=Hydrogenophaga sp. TaxID=1904254 RepID=UPI00169D7BDD|nr:hypothetical protein [Hydrogenophaga sp.]NIM39749.1 hypothetical protein [Hydrogenophaga sp.]NIN24953.1 hypothetical protein [Hydrogenophaga sp.]NIN29465.1 hypothetical protein [Hydrogenophaga sp.]NIN53988.1 hypothetical protein [Hydrogenophaga sp.]NIO50192.1 hypothetical protein [Hydrogenophaga sp.]